jgi:hypothetical protein
MTTVFCDGSAKPRMHALVAGVGAYKHLSGGEHPATVWPGPDLGQLTSPPISAEAVGRWLLTNQTTDPDKPLGSLEMVVSPSLRLDTQQDGGVQVDVEVEAATMSGFQESFDRWYQRCNASDENVAFFYFTGHGIQKDTLALLLEDVGISSVRFFDQSFDFDGLYDGMASCNAGVQCYFVDACRTRPDKDKWKKVQPRQLLQIEFRPAYRDAPKIFSTVEGEDAYGKPGECTEFTTALLTALDQCAAERSPREATWRVTTESIGKTIRQLLERDSLLPALFQSEGSARGGAIRTLIGDPFVPFRLKCLPEEALAVARMQLVEGTGQVGARRDLPECRVWEDKIRADKYDFKAVFADSIFRECAEPIWMDTPFVDRNFSVHQA